jgi:hypothetical protein
MWGLCSYKVWGMSAAGVGWLLSCTTTNIDPVVYSLLFFASWYVYASSYPAALATCNSLLTAAAAAAAAFNLQALLSLGPRTVLTWLLLPQPLSCSGPLSSRCHTTQQTMRSSRCAALQHCSAASDVGYDGCGALPSALRACHSPWDRQGFPSVTSSSIMQ